MTKYLIAAIVALVLALGAALWGLKALSVELGGTQVALESAQAALHSQKALTTRIQTQVAFEKARAEAARMELRNALKNNQDWARTPVPPDVAGSLCKPPALCAPGAGTVR